MSQDRNCPFCEIAQTTAHQRIIGENDHAFMIRDGYPVSDGHSLIISRRHVASFFEISECEKISLLELIDQAKFSIEKEYRPSAYNIGINDGQAAGQTIPHLHIHVIPRYVELGVDPRGGVRWVIPAKADYWSAS